MHHYLFAILIVLSSSFTAHSASQTDCTKHHCIAVVNAGSTGSRVYIYSYDLDSTHTPINITEVWNNSIKPGLANMMHEPSTVPSYLNKLFEQAPTYKLRVYFYATAGMRLVSKTDSNSVYNLIKKWFTQKKNLNLVDIRTISGEEEGFFDWLSVNYQLKRLNQDNQPLVAVIDIGGASTQIALPIHGNKKSIKKLPHLYSFSLYGKTLKIVSYSFLGLGENELLDGFKSYFPCYTQGYPLSAESKGTGNMLQCVQSISKKMNAQFSLNQIKTIVSHYPPKEWYLIGGITDMLKENNLSINDKFTNHEMASLSGKNLCQNNWSQLQKQYSGKELFKACAASSYLYSLLVNGYGLPIKQSIHLMPSNTNSDWALGVVFAHY